ncbi:hypothetical protein ABBQ38_009110 [Trebouxia sp. C0009 RCD-2024]
MSSGRTARWSDLSLELWVNILSRLEDNVDPKFAWDSWICLKGFAQMRSNMQKLRLVCTKFNTAFDDAQLSRSVFLRKDFANRNLPSLLQWLHRQRTSLRLLQVDDGSPNVEAALAALVCPGTQLALVFIANISAAAVHILPCHTGLHSINIGSESSECIDLTPLAVLPDLGKLIISTGQFKCSEPLSHLTNLQLSRSTLTTTPANCFLKLLKLRLEGSHCKWPGPGLAACHNLKELTLRNCGIEASHDADQLELRYDLLARVPTVMSALTQLTKLDVTFDVDYLDDMEFLWLASLVSLKELGFHGHATDGMDLPHEVSDLTNLTKLWLTMGGLDDAAESMEVQINWQDMRALKWLCIGPGLFTFDSDLLQLVGCTSLKTLHFYGVRPDSTTAESAKFFGALIGILAVQRPDVELCLDQVQVSHMHQI